MTEETTKQINECKGDARQGYDMIKELCKRLDTYDMIHELSKRLDSVWRYDQYFANAIDDVELKMLWMEFKEEEKNNIRRLKKQIQKYIAKGYF
ncbi:MAG: hypothetical protein P1V20_03565 [Verrucomicrobiales bacterium]|nr:hypothetical protein [Verrucomicrobiales bacterium]